ncbi:MAG: HD domain-containing phosphohydrolase, partial [bacterium]|nr:HD domain-containing phosphohydrolase [bacterium]
HSERVATLSTALAKQVDEIHWGKFKQIQFSRDQIQQIHYAALLHDFGKIGVRENILVKEKKLFPHELESVKNRFKIYSKAKLLQTTQQKVDYLLKTDKNRALEYFNDLDNEIKQQLMKLDEFLQLIIEINEPTVLNESRREILRQIAAIAIQDNGQTSHLLTQIELSRLSIVRGSLSPEERVEIESHVNHTYNFLNRIPWTKELKVIPQIAYAHHEKLDGSGYPRGLTDAEIPIQSKMMVIADIYDALTAWDRPYKKAVPVEKALQILQYEVNEGKIDPDLFQVFVEAKLYQLVQKPA